MRPVPIKLYKLPCHVCFCSSNIEYVLPFLLDYSKFPLASDTLHYSVLVTFILVTRPDLTRPDPT